MLKKIISAVIFIVIIFGIVYYFSNVKKEVVFEKLDDYKMVSANVGSVETKLYVANTPEKMIKGLSGVEKLEDNEGMIFVYPDEGERIFWMKDMNFPIDILWFNSNNEIVHIEENVLPENYPERYGEGVMAQYIMEFNAGFIERNSLISQ